jgi:hypothetical protein
MASAPKTQRPREIINAAADIPTDMVGHSEPALAQGTQHRCDQHPMMTTDGFGRSAIRPRIAAMKNSTTRALVNLDGA